MNLDQSFLRALEKRDHKQYPTEYSRFIEQAMINKVQEHCKTWLRNDSGGRKTMLSPQLAKAKMAKSQENIKFIYKQMEQTINTNKSFAKPKPSEMKTEPMQQRSQTSAEKLKQQLASHRQSLESESRSPTKHTSSQQLKQMILKLNQKPAEHAVVSKLNLTNLPDKSVQHQRSQTYREYDMFQVNLFDGQGKHLDQFAYKITEKTTTDFTECLVERFQLSIQYNSSKDMPSSRRIIGFQTIDSRIPIDYYLTLREKELTLLSGLTLNLRPLYAEQTSERLTLDSFNFQLCIGVGGFSRVFLVRCKQTGVFMALKLIAKSFITENDKHQIIQNERDIMVQLSQQKEPHPFLCKLLCAFETRRWVVFGVEYCPGGELFQQLRRVRKMNEVEARFYFLEVCLAILHLHQNNVIYRDIKPENILIDCDGHVKVADFGLSRPDMTEEALAYSFCGSPEYMAPEMLLKEGHNNQIDHYCLGALLYELLTGLPPFYSRDTDKIYKNILTKELQFPNGVCSPESRDLIAQLLAKERQNRMGRTHGIFEILNHPWLRKTQLQSVMSKQIAPPFVPNLLSFNFDEKEVSKGELNFQRELQQSLQNEEENNFPRLFDNFYFEAQALKPVIKRQRKAESLADNQLYELQRQQHDSHRLLESYQTQQDMRSRSNDLKAAYSSQQRSHADYLKASESLDTQNQSMLSRVCSVKQIFKQAEHFASHSTLKSVKPSAMNVSRTSSNIRNKQRQTPQKTPSKNAANTSKIFMKENQAKPLQASKQLDRSTTKCVAKPNPQLKKRVEKNSMIRLSQPNYTVVRTLITDPDESTESIAQAPQPKPVYQKSAYNKTLQNIFNDFNVSKRPSSNVPNQDRSRLYQTHIDQSTSNLKFFNIKHV